MRNQNREYTFVEHLEDLRRKLFKSSVVLLIVCFFVYPHVNKLLAFFLRPVGRLYFLSPTEAFVTHMVLTVTGGFFFASPYIFFQLWQFVSLALTEKEKKYVSFFFPLSVGLFVMGCCFSYFAVLPLGLSFLLSFSSESVVPMIALGKYISFSVTIIGSFGLLFEFPLLVVFLTQIGMITPALIIEKRKHAIVLIFIVSALLTPPDWVTQVFMAFPLVMLYELSIILAKIVLRCQLKRTPWHLER